MEERLAKSDLETLVHANSSEKRREESDVRRETLWCEAKTRADLQLQGDVRVFGSALDDLCGIL